MKQILVVLQTLVLVGSVAAGEHDRYTVTFAPSDDGRVELFSIPRSDVENLPSWNPGVEEPPLSVGEALTAGRKWLKNLGNGSDQLPLVDVHLARKWSVGMPEVWFYHLLFSTTPKRRSEAVKSRYVVVLMDGRVLDGDKMTEKEFEDLHQR